MVQTLFIAVNTTILTAMRSLWKFFKFILTLLLTAYLCLWLYVYVAFNKEVDRLYERAQDEGYELLGPRPTLTNFPLIPIAVYETGIRAGDLEILFPEARLKGFPIPHLPMDLEFPAGVSLGGVADPSTWMLDTLSLRVIIPRYLPSELTRDELQYWQQTGGIIDVRDFDITRHGLVAAGKGHLQLDGNLQPQIHLDASVKGHENLIRFLLETEVLPPFAAAALNGVMNSFARPDPASGEMVVPVIVTLENQILRIGPLQVARLPEIDWDRHRPPAPHQ